MPIIKSAKKAARQSLKHKNNNEAIKKAIRNALKEFRANPTAENKAAAQSEYDKAAKKGLIKKNTASRRKANLDKIAKAANVKAEKPAKATAKKTTEKTEAAEKKPAAKKTAAKKTTKKAE